MGTETTGTTRTPTKGKELHLQTCQRLFLALQPNQTNSFFVFIPEICQPIATISAFNTSQLSPQLSLETLQNDSGPDRRSWTLGLRPQRTSILTMLSHLRRHPDLLNCLDLLPPDRLSNSSSSHVSTTPPQLNRFSTLLNHQDKRLHPLSYIHSHRPNPGLDSWTSFNSSRSLNQGILSHTQIIQRLENRIDRLCKEAIKLDTFSSRLSGNSSSYFVSPSASSRFTAIVQLVWSKLRVTHLQHYSPRPTISDRCLNVILQGTSDDPPLYSHQKSRELIGKTADIDG